MSGSVYADSFTIRKNIRYRNSFQIVLKGSFRQGPEGVIISGRFGMHAFVQIFMALWFGLLVLFGVLIGGGALVSYFSHQTAANESGSVGLGIIGLPIMILFGIGLVAFGRFLSREEPEFLTNLLMELLDAREMKPRPTPGTDSG